jgi:ABC-type glycerol-3-phosphate transport system permease component
VSASRILTFLEKWNDFLWPLVTIDSVERMPLPVGLSDLMSEHSTDRTRMAGDIISILPVLLLLVVAQRSSVRGIALTGLKG